MLTLAFTSQHPPTFYLLLNINHTMYIGLLYNWHLEQNFIAYFLKSLHCLEGKWWGNLEITAGWVSRGV